MAGPPARVRGAGAPHPLVADLYRRWYELSGIEPRRLLVESFVVLEPWWMLRTASVPSWTKFSVEPDAEALERFVAERDPFPEIAALLFSRCVPSPTVSLLPERALSLDDLDAFLADRTGRYAARLV